MRPWGRRCNDVTPVTSGGPYTRGVGLLARLERAVGRFNRWFGGAAVATQAENAAPTQVRTMAATTVADEVEVATSPDAPSAGEAEVEPPPEDRAG